MTLKKTSGMAAGLTAALVLALAMPAKAIPAFARKYHTTCARCHSEVPRLNNYGWNFKLRGFHVPGDEDIGKISMPEDKNLHLLDQVPLALRLMGNVQWSSARGSQGTSTLDSEIDLLSGGALARRIGYWAEVDTARNPDGTFSVSIGNLRAIFRDLCRRQPTALNLEVGKFNIDEFGISTGRNLTQNPYAIYNVGDALGNIAESEEVQGFNVFGAFGTGIGKGVVSAEPKAGKAGEVTEEERKKLEQELNQGPAKPPPDTPEMIAARAVLNALVKKGTLTQEDADKTLEELASKLVPPPQPEQKPPVPALVTLAKSDYDTRKGLFYQAGLVTRGSDGGSRPQGYARLILADKHDWWVSPVAYFGSNRIANNPNFADNFTRYGVEAGFTAGPRRDVAGVSRRAFEFLLAGQYGSDSNAAGTGVRAEHVGGFAEVAYLADDRNLFVLRWDRLDSGKMPAANVNALTFNYSHYLTRNLKVGAEFVPDFLRNSDTHVRGDQFLLFYDFTL